MAEEMSSQEIAQALGVSRVYVDEIIKKALQRVKQRLTRYRIYEYSDISIEGEMRDLLTANPSDFEK